MGKKKTRRAQAPPAAEMRHLLQAADRAWAEVRRLRDELGRARRTIIELSAEVSRLRAQAESCVVGERATYWSGTDGRSYESVIAETAERIAAQGTDRLPREADLVPPELAAGLRLAASKAQLHGDEATRLDIDELPDPAEPMPDPSALRDKLRGYVMQRVAPVDTSPPRFVLSLELGDDGEAGTEAEGGAVRVPAWVNELLRVYGPQSAGD